MPKHIGEGAGINPDYFNQGRSVAEKKPDGVQLHEIGEATNFLRPYGKTYQEALENLITGSIQIIGLDEVKAQYGAQWGSIKKNVMKITDAYLSRKLSRHDIYVPLDEGHFALLFAGVTREEALVKAKEISRDLVNKLFGELPGGELISVEAAMLEIGDFEGLDRIRTLEGLVKCFREAIIKSRDKEAREFRENKPGISIRFRPLINRRKGFVGMNEVVSYRETDGGATDLKEDDPVFTGSPRLRAEMDFLMLKETGEMLAKLGGKANKPIIFLSVHFETLANSFCRGKYARILASFSSYTEHHLLLNVQDIAAGVPNSRYRQIFTSLRSLVLGFTFEVTPTWSEFEAIRDLPVRAITLAGHESLEIWEIDSLFKRAKRHGKKCIWRSIDHDELGRAAFKMEVDYVSGPIFGTVQAVPSRPFSLPK
ncbi:MAG: hypothetical protein K9G33_15825 [Sneathiella sp.]|nr:hypothetical protein [Sneathiella sp.]